MPHESNAASITDRVKSLAAERTKQAYTEYAERDLKPYLDLMITGLTRANRLVRRAVEFDKETSHEILRAAVVLEHAYLEDFLRTIALVFLPSAGEEALNDIPLAGLTKTGRAEKFFLGKLARHRGRTVDDLIQQSVMEHLERATFNSVTEVMVFLESIGVQIPKEDENTRAAVGVTGEQESKIPSMLEAMMRRRHHIVHRADRAKDGNGLQPIDATEVLDWLTATTYFMSALAKAAFLKLHPVEEFVEGLVEEWKLAVEPS